MNIRLANKSDEAFFNGELLNDRDAMIRLNAVGIGEFVKNDKWVGTFVGGGRTGIQGFVKVEFFSDPPQARIQDLYVLKKERRKGVARELIRYAMQFAMDSWPLEMFNAMTIENPKMEFLLKELGFVNKGTYKDLLSRGKERYDQTFWVKKV